VTFIAGSSRSARCCPIRSPPAPTRHTPPETRKQAVRNEKRETNPGQARRAQHAHRSGARRTRDGDLDPRPQGVLDLPGRYTTAMPDPSTSLAFPNAPPRLVLRPASARSVMPWTTRWPKPRSACSKNSSTTAAPGKAIDDVELATLEWVDWHNPRRLHSACNDFTPAGIRTDPLPSTPTTEAGVSTT
jgi:hypothetical protein